MIVCHILLGILLARGISAGSGSNWGASKPSATSKNVGGATWGTPSAPATEKAQIRLESTGRVWGSSGGSKKIPQSQLRGLDSKGKIWGTPRGSVTPIKERQIIGTFVQYL